VILNIDTVVAYLFGLFLLYILMRLLYVPLKFVLTLVVNGVIGGLLLVVFNILGSLFGISIGINLVTAVIAGFLGIPGILLMIILKYFVIL